jgi:hypothetical protein
VTPEQLKLQATSRYATFAALLQDDGWFDPVHKKLCDWIQWNVQEGLRAGKEDIKLAIVMPRGSLKSTIVTKYLPIFLVLSDPNLRCLIASNTFPNARKKLEDIRGVFDGSELFRALFPELLPKPWHRWTNDCAEVNRTTTFPEGTFEAAGMKTQLTGRHYSMIIEDDTLAPSESDMGEEILTPSKEEIEKGISFHKATTYLYPPKGTRISVVVTTRWSEDDLISHIMAHENYKLFDMPAMTGGVCNFSMFYSPAKLEEIKQKVGPYMFSCLYLNQPLDPTQKVFNPSWFNYVYESDIPQNNPEGAVRVWETIAIDPAISEKDNACDTAITKVIHVQEGNRSFQYWSKAIADKLNPFDIVKKTLDMASDCINLRTIIVESNAFQASLKYYLYDAMAQRNQKFDITPLQTRTNKDLRIQGMVPYFAGARIFFLHGLNPRVESQLRQYPHGKLVDIIDCFSMHRKQSGADKALEIPHKPKAQPDHLTGEAILKELRTKYNMKTYGRKYAPKSDICQGIATGLGVAVDVRRSFGGLLK